MTVNEAPTEVTESQSVPVDISNPDISFSDYERVRRGETVTVSAKQSAPEVKTPEQKPAAQSDAAESEEDETLDSSATDDGTEHDEKPRKKGGFQRRIDKLNEKAANAANEAAYWKELATKNAGEIKKEPVESKSVEGKPSQDDFETNAEYVEALTEWKLDQREKTAAEKSEKAKLEADHKKALDSHATRLKSFVDKTPDFQEKFEALSHLNNITLVQLVIDSEVGPEILYELAKNPDEAERICKLGPLAIAREIGKLETKIEGGSSAEQKQETKKITTAPKPIAPVGKGASAPIPKRLDDPNLSFNEYEKMRREQMSKRR